MQGPHPALRRCAHVGDLVGVRGFEPPTPCSRSRCATRLRYTPTVPRGIAPPPPQCKRHKAQRAGPYSAGSGASRIMVDTRGATGVPNRDRVRNTGVVSDTPSRASRSTM